MSKPQFVEVTEQKRLNAAREGGVPWKKWGPYLSERQWGTVREDYSDDGNAWAYFSHDQSRSRAYRWGEDGLGGISDDAQRLCFALALWNERDPILKERLFGLTNSEGNHGEDVKEYYFYVDSTPTHSYMKYLYKYPQREFPYRDLVETNGRRSREEMEYELLDTGIFAENRYFDVFVEYAKSGPEDVLARITVHNRGPEAARLHVLPTLWFRNTWSWGDDDRKPSLGASGPAAIQATHHELGTYTLACDGRPELLFTDNESNSERLWNQPAATPYVKDAFHRYVVGGQHGAVNPARTGTKAAAHYVLDVPAGGSQVVRVHLTGGVAPETFKEFDAVVEQRLAEANEFYTTIAPASLTDDERRVHRQALAGMLWSKQFYYFDLERWLSEHDSHPLATSAKHGVRNTEWFHMLNADVISMPDKWEYPWYAAWDLAFHTVALALVDFDFAKDQLLLMLRNLYCHPNGQIPAYEWNFSDVNPPVHAWATLYLYKMERNLGRADLRFLERSFQGLMLNFNWWVNRKDPSGRNVFAGGFLGLDNIGVFDRSAPLPTGGTLEQADGTAWMAFYCQCMLEMALILSEYDPMYEEVAFKFLQHFAWIAYAMDRIGEHHDEMWDEADGFYYDLLRTPDGQAGRLKVRSMVGLLPLCAATVFDDDLSARYPQFSKMVALFRKRHPDLVAQIAPTDSGFLGYRNRRLLGDPEQEEAGAGALLPPRRTGVPRAVRDPFPVAGSPGSAVRVLAWPPGVPRLVPAGRIEQRDVRRQLELARPGVDAGQRADRSRAAEFVRVLRRRLHRRVPGRIRHEGDALRGRQGDFPPARRDVPARCERPSAGLRRDRDVPAGPALAGPDPVLRVFPRRERRRPRRESPDGVDRARRRPARPLRSRGCEDPAGDGAPAARGGSRPRAGDGRADQNLMSASALRILLRRAGCPP